MTRLQGHSDTRASGLEQPVRIGLVGLLLVGAGVSVALAVYGGVHTPSARPLFSLGFSGVLPMKAWLATVAASLLVVQVVTALWMWGRLPGAGRAPAWLGPVHRWSGTSAFVLSLPVAVHCLWALGFATGSPRVLLHGLAGCAFYGACAAKMLGLRQDRLPSWALPVLGSLVLTLFVLAWLTSALWFFSRSGIPKV